MYRPGRCFWVFLLTICLYGASTAHAGRPSYLIMRTPFGPPAANHRFDGYGYGVNTHTYAYGWFGASPRPMRSRQYGYYRTYTQWTFR